VLVRAFKAEYQWQRCAVLNTIQSNNRWNTNTCTFHSTLY